MSAADSFETPQEFARLVADAKGPSAPHRKEAEARNAQLTKPAGALGRLEDVASWYCSWRGDARATVMSPQVVVFAGNHGVTAQNISAFPSEVTAQMVANFAHGGAAINQLCRAVGATLDVIPLDLETPTADFSQTAAMTPDELVRALAAGWDAVNDGADVFIAGEMGIGNTTAAAAICLALFGGDAADWAGPGTGLDNTGVSHKAAVIAAAVKRHGVSDPMEVLRHFGGREIAAMAGAMASARDKGIPVILDGFIASSAAAVLHRISPAALDHVVAGHVSSETAHARLLDKLGKVALLDLGLRLGEGSGAALALPILKAALACHSGMATFAEAGVSDG